MPAKTLEAKIRRFSKVDNRQQRQMPSEMAILIDKSFPQWRRYPGLSLMVKAADGDAEVIGNDIRDAILELMNYRLTNDSMTVQSLQNSLLEVMNRATPQTAPGPRAAWAGGRNRA